MTAKHTETAYSQVHTDTEDGKKGVPGNEKVVSYREFQKVQSILCTVWMIHETIVCMFYVLSLNTNLGRK